MMCEIAKVNVAVFRQIDDKLIYVNGVFIHGGEIVCVKLVPNNIGDVHSHFERVLTYDTLLNLDIQKMEDEYDAHFVAQDEAGHSGEAA